MQNLVPLEHVTRVAPLGLGFWDTVTGSLIADNGLQVSALPEGARVSIKNPAVPVRNRSGIFAFHHLPGLGKKVENGTGDVDFWNHLPPRKNYIITVEDDYKRFLPFKISAQAPERYEDPWGRPAANAVPDINQPLLPGVIPLFSSPGRPIPYGMAGIRASIIMDGKPAAWARVDAYSQDDWEHPAATTLVARGIADRKGQVALIFPYPKFMAVAGGMKNPPLTAQRWLISLKIFFSPKPFYPEIPHRSEIATQTEMQALVAPPIPPDAAIPAGKAVLQYGVELILRTQSESELQIQLPEP